MTLQRQGAPDRIRPDTAVKMNEMDPENSVESFIQLARQSLEIQSRLADCSIDLWGSEHLPLDVDLAKVLAVASEYGFSLSEQDVIQSQCKKLAEFWQFEMDNAFVARRTLNHIQYQLSASVVDIDYYEY